MTHYRTTPPTRRARTLAAVAFGCFCAAALVPWKLVAQEQPPPGAGQQPRGVAPHGPGEGADPAGVPGGPAPGYGGRAAEADPLTAQGGVLGRGYVMAPQFRINARVGGTLTDVPVRAGQRVKKGELLVRIDDAATRAELEAAEARVEVGKLEMVRAREKNAATDEQVAKAQLRIAMAQVALVQHKLESARVLAPADGVLADVGAKEGAAVREGAPLATLVAVDTLSFETSVGADVLARLKEGQKARLRIDALAPTIFEAEVTYISPQVELNTGQARVGLRIHDPKGVRPGMSGTAAIRVEEGDSRTYREAFERDR
jgi:membrane fusion protein (multidrug efflux system)